ncbi:protein DA1-related 1-like isoform X1 [Amaranthus tricolor]|uniref:protein DA1-related 1-like isoform X1 n=2 Tax=Amaranthus tricolor TaxID=29722 RepID=UPI00258D90F1|nr:protein DA1-related 1-like isoform X1 [Amaranthus tricolor]XP_057541865.1 protein DA1-related 1-like isoform X1 [Amaranthus tricolor]XP_057541866.1 protein DA1-related 1-like isoform X1 [Amaranthus tricolor]
MGWLSKIFGGSSHSHSHGISEGQYNGQYGEESNWDGPTTSGGELSDYENNEDIDHAIALSLAEEEERQREKDQKGKHVIDHDSQLEEDELLAKALQESLNMDSPAQTPPETPPRLPVQPLPQLPPQPTPHFPPPIDRGNMWQPYPFFSYGYRTCSGCGAEIGHGRYLSCMGGFWHPECFRCHSCNEPITDYEFSMSRNRPFHKLCYKEQHHPRCDVCQNFIPTNAAGLIEYRAHPFWMQKYCPSHEYDKTPRCCSCERMEPRDTNYLVLDDGRKLCLECLDSAIVDTNECQPLYLEIQEFYEGLNMKVEQQVPLLLVERQALNEAMEGEKQGHYHLPETRGLCLSEEQTVRTILRRPRIGGGHKIMDMITEPYRLIRRCEVTAILILYGLPRLLTGSILAHEMMHAWLRLNGYPNLRPDVEEGICQVLAHMWLESEIVAGSSSSSGASSSSSSSPMDPGASSSSSSSSKKGKRSPFERKLGDFFKHQIESDASPAYGEGFRIGNQAVNKYGLRRTLDHIRLTGSFPC